MLKTPSKQFYDAVSAAELFGLTVDGFRKKNIPPSFQIRNRVYWMLHHLLPYLKKKPLISKNY